MNHVSISRKKLPIPICFITLAIRLSVFSQTGNITKRTKPMNERPMNLSMIQFTDISPIRTAIERPRMYITKSSEDTMDWYIWPLENFDSRSISRVLFLVT